MLQIKGIGHKWDLPYGKYIYLNGWYSLLLRFKLIIILLYVVFY